MVYCICGHSISSHRKSEGKGKRSTLLIGCKFYGIVGAQGCKCLRSYESLTLEAKGN